jgi:hypothetical protein
MDATAMNPIANTAAIDIILCGRKIAVRRWTNVPREGDAVIVGGEFGALKVRRVIWAEDRDYDCYVQLLCEPDTTVRVQG